MLNEKNMSVCPFFLKKTTILIWFNYWLIIKLNILSYFRGWNVGKSPSKYDLTNLASNMKLD